ncbi:glycogen debranching protein [Candidatus Neptunochlamydia vexilliferae]|nr:isoamylase [Candidatus Neptunochlamydia vexilliferae]
MVLGVTQVGNKTTFALYSSHITALTLCLFKEGALFLETPLEKQGNIWSITLEDLPETYEYTYRIGNVEVIDPYAKRLTTRGVVTPPLPFDWENDARPLIPDEELVVYEMHVGGLTKDPSSRVEKPGTFLGMIEKIPHLKELGINGVELLPIHTFDPQKNYWGYATENFFTPLSQYGTPEDFKALVKTLHAAGIEVILDVVYNHTGTGAPFEEIDPATYYLMRDGEHLNYSGCGNTLNCNHPVVQDLIVDSLRHFVTEYHVDGFRFDLAPILTRGNDGEPLENPPLLKRLERDPILGPTRLIAETWDAAGLYQVGCFPSYHFGEWNDQFRNTLRHFIRGDGDYEAVKKRLEGSPDFYDNPDKSYNFITIHDGFTLRDLVSYDHKHNEANGEDNRDGIDDNISWSCGAEGPTDDSQILALREKQMRNFFLALLIAKGVPILLMGDEYGHTKEGNNNTWAQDSQLNYFLWDALEKNRPLFQFASKLIALRKKFLPLKDWIWLGDTPLAALIDNKVIVAFNPLPSDATLPLPEGSWTRLIDTHLPHEKEEEAIGSYALHPFSAILLVAT